MQLLFIIQILIFKPTGSFSIRRLASLAYPELTRSSRGIPFRPATSNSSARAVKYTPTKILLYILQSRSLQKPSTPDSRCGGLSNRRRWRSRALWCMFKLPTGPPWRKWGVSVHKERPKLSFAFWPEKSSSSSRTWYGNCPIPIFLAGP